MLRYLPLLAWKWPMKCSMVFSSSVAASLGRREWAGGQPAVAPTLGIILVATTLLSNWAIAETKTTFSTPGNFKWRVYFNLDFLLVGLLFLFICSARSECILSEAEREFLREVEELHVTSGAENDVDHLVTSISKEKLKLYANYCNCQDLETFSSFCKKVLAKFLSTDSPAFESSKAEVSKHSIRGKNFISIRCR